MPIHNANLLVREARLKSGLTQEQLSEGICTPQALSRIENGTENVSHVTFQALMARAGAQYGRFPVFNSRDGFECFYGLKRARLYLDAWQLQAAYTELDKLEEKNWADNKLYYQEWLLLHCRLQFLSGCCSHQQNYETLLDALHITRPNIDLSDFRECLLSQNEIQLLTCIAQEALYINMPSLCRNICEQLDSCLISTTFALIEKGRMQADTAIVYAKYLMRTENYNAALKVADSHRKEAVIYTYDSPLIELTFITGLCCHFLKYHSLADIHIKAAFYSAQAIESCYATLCRDYLKTATDYRISGSMTNLATAPLTDYPAKVFQASVQVADGLYETNMNHPYTLGKLIQDLRFEQKVSQQVLCHGLCSKSKLSKIENDTLQPNVALTTALLQRLGISGKIFPFWGSQKDAEFYDLYFKATHHVNVPKDNIIAYMNKMEQLLDKDDILYRQEYLSAKAFQSDSADERIRCLTEALLLTLPEFDIHKICSYRLTCEELSILNNLAHEYRRTKKAHLSVLYFLQILAYVHKAKPDILLQTKFLPITGYMYCHSLYMLKFYQETVALPDSFDMSIMNFFITGYNTFLFFYSQALGECSCFEKAHIAAVQSYAISILMEREKNASLLKQYLHEDFGLKLNY